MVHHVISISNHKRPTNKNPTLMVPLESPSYYLRLKGDIINHYCIYYSIIDFDIIDKKMH